MSFKREGDDHSLLNDTKKRRVAELFGEDIPHDEALLLKNGTIACVVCSHKPIFDTIQMLAVHRGGRKHIANLEYRRAEKHEIEGLIQKRQHEKYVKDGQIKSLGPKLGGGRGGGSGGGSGGRRNGGSVNESLHTVAPYDPRAGKFKKQDRKPTLNILASNPGESSSPVNESRTETATHRILDRLSAGKIQFSNKKPQIEVKPYRRKNSDSVTKKQKESDSMTSQGQTSDVYHKTLYATNTGEGELVRSDHGHQVASSVATDKPGVKVKQKGKLKEKPKEYGPVDEATEERRRQAEKYLQLTSSGWKKGLDGKWTKDEEVEFDSDEETPDLP